MEYIQFDRYNWNLKFLFLENKIQLELNPSDFSTTKEEVDWYVKALLDAQSRFNSFQTKWSQRIIIGPFLVFVILSVIVGVLIGWFHIIMPFSSYIIYLFICWGVVSGIMGGDSL